MATFNEITEVVLYPIDMDADPVTFTGASALKAYNGFVNGRPFMATANGMSDPELWWSPTAFAHMRVTRESTDIDMSDNSCVESASGDVVFRFELSKGSYVNVTKDMLECQDTGGGYMGGFFIPNAQLPVGESYDASVGGQIYRLGVETHDGSSYMRNELFMFTDVPGGIGGQALLTGGGTFSSCEEMETYTLNLFTGAYFDIVGDDPK